MKKVSIFVLALVMSLAFVATVFAQAGTPEKKETTTTTTTTPEKKETITKVKKSKAMMFQGEVTTMDTAAKTMTVKGKKGDMTFDVSDATMKGEVKAGDKVTVKYMEKDGKMMASAVKMGKKMKTTTTSTKEKTEETTAPAK
ncbi:MAG TPA: hypothetical protein VGJ94_01260 [Syntrophorhabdaceae bacterium]|jgi:microtubule-associated protein 1